ncbi:hypothetical protein [Micromonospora sp. NPDC049679]|uniref:hypothetical protein n=1 Tax=Micromonospora sp. NPDC049679 TaxID=3155920 RepID=UPI0033DC97C4
MTSSAPDDVVATLRDFVDRIDAVDPAAAVLGEIEVRVAGDVAVDKVRLTLTAPVARALVEALRGYHDPRDRGCCDHCGGRRLDDNFLCLDCHRPSGLFGQMIMERAARHGRDRAAVGYE